MDKFSKALTKAVHNTKMNEKQVTTNGGKMSPRNRNEMLKTELKYSLKEGKK